MSSGNKNINGLFLASAIGLGIWGAYQVIGSKVYDYNNAIKFGLANFKFTGLEKDASGKLNYSLLNVVIEFNIANLSNSSLNIPDLMLSIEYQAEDKNYYSFAYTKAPISLTLGKKSTSRVAFPIQVSVQQVLSAGLYKMLYKPVNFQISAFFSVMGFRQISKTVISVSLPSEILQAVKLLLNGVNGLGMTAQSQRKIKPGTEFNSLIEGWQKPNKDRLILNNPDTEEVVAEMIKMAAEVKWQTRKLANYLYDKNPKVLAKRIYEFVYNHIQYRLDKDRVEELREPARLWRERHSGGDCDCMALFISTLLHNLKIPHYFRTIKLHQNDDYQHIYVIMPIAGKKFIWYNPDTYVVIDPVMEYFDGKDPHGVSGVLDYKSF